MIDSMFARPGMRQRARCNPNLLTSILLPCWNALDLTQVCVSQLMRWTTRPFELLIVDNGSTDGTGAWLKSWRRRAAKTNAFLRGVTILSNRVNRGYPIAMNQAIAAVRGELLVFANADAAPGPLWLEEMAAQFVRRKRLGGLAPCVNPPASSLRNSPWSVRPWYDDLQMMARFATACALRSTSKSFFPAAAFVPGFWFMTRRSVLDQVGGFDERFSPGGYEDWDFQWRVRQAGFEIGFAGRAYVHHEWSGVFRRNALRGDAFYRVNKRLLYAKHPAVRGLSLQVKLPL